MNAAPILTEADVAAVARQMRSFWIGRGDTVAALERKMCAWVGASHAIALGSGTAALALAIQRSGAAEVAIPAGACDALQHATLVAGARDAVTGVRISIYPKRNGYIEDFAKHLPERGEVNLEGRFGVFSFGALKDVSGGIGGCLVANEPIEAETWRRVSPISDINAAMILAQLERYRGHCARRIVAGGLIWEGS